MLNKQQEEAKDLIVKWYNNGSPNKLYFVLAGYAGTGKTFLVNYLVKNVLNLSEKQVAYIAPTGKAASILIQRGATNAVTLHKLIYNLVEMEYETEIDGKIIKSKKREFVRKPEIPAYKLIILDETSMVDSKMMQDLLSFGRPVLCCGDIGQLPPVGKPNGLLDNPDYNLTEIVRQEEDNMIVKIATMARNGQPIVCGDYGNVKVLRKDLIGPAMMKTLLTKCDQVICGTNKTRASLNFQIKSYLGLDTTKLNVGEKIICLLNNWEKYIDDNDDYALVNGLIGYATKVHPLFGVNNCGMLSFKSDFLDTICPDLPYDKQIFSKGEFAYKFHQQLYVMGDGSYQLKEAFTPKKENESIDKYYERLKEFVEQRKDAMYSENLNFFDTAYAISCHKAQGSEWNNVVVFDESWIFEEPNKWLYTACTRAKKNLIIIK